MGELLSSAYCVYMYKLGLNMGLLITIQSFYLLDDNKDTSEPVCFFLCQIDACF